MEVIILMLMLFGIVGTETKLNYEACKKEEFKPAVCERYKSLIPPAKK
jgi:hypothetical protein